MSRLFSALCKHPEPLLTTLGLDVGNGTAHSGCVEDGPLDNPSSKLADIVESDKSAKKPVPTIPVHLPSNCPLQSDAAKDAYAAEQYRIVRTKTGQLLRKPFRVVITSPSVGDGKTLTAVNLAVAMAMRSNEKTLLVDADLRNSGIRRRLNVRREPGLADVLAGKRSVANAIFDAGGVPGLYVITAGQAAVNPTELLDSSRWSELTGTLSRHFAQVVIDSPPIDVVADFDLIAAACDGVILVVRPDSTDRTRCFAAIDKLGSRLTGILINAAPDWFLSKRPKHDYSYYGRRAEDCRNEEHSHAT